MFPLLARDMLINEIAWGGLRFQVKPDNIVNLMLSSCDN